MRRKLSSIDHIFVNPITQTHNVLLTPFFAVKTFTLRWVIFCNVISQKELSPWYFSRDRCVRFQRGAKDKKSRQKAKEAKKIFFKNFKYCKLVQKQLFDILCIYCYLFFIFMNKNFCVWCYWHAHLLADIIELNKLGHFSRNYNFGWRQAKRHVRPVIPNQGAVRRS